jgi:hypothetical protein
VEFAALAKAIRQKGHEVRAQPDEGDRSFLRYAVEGSTAEVHVVRDDSDQAHQAAQLIRPGEVWSISL